MVYDHYPGEDVYYNKTMHYTTARNQGVTYIITARFAFMHYRNVVYTYQKAIYEHNVRTRYMR